jgi:hypothetical protein
MTRETCLLAEIPEFGRVYDCGECGFIHVKVGPVSVTLPPEAYMQLVALIHTSAANFETWLMHQQNSPHARQEGDAA